MNIKRNDYLKRLNDYKDSDFVKVLTGIKRSGKTTLLRSWACELKEKGINDENIIFISLESPEYNTITNSAELDKTVYEKANNIKGKIYLFLDEIQHVKEWEKSVNGYGASLDCDIYIASSNSRLLSGELAMLIISRCININVYPFSFKEFLQYKKEINDVELTKESITSLFDEYTNYGGIPRILAFESYESKTMALIDIYHSIVFSEILCSFNVKNIDLLSRYIQLMFNSIGETYSSKKIKDYLKSNGEITTQNTILRYNDYLKQCFFLSKCSRYDLKADKIIQIKEKYYLMDHGFHHILIRKNNENLQTIIENMVYIELLRREYNVNVGRLAKDQIDFVCEKSGKYIYIQVSYTIAQEKTMKREIKPFFKIPDRYDTYIITTDTHDLSYKGVKHLNIIDFLLGDEI